MPPAPALETGAAAALFAAVLLWGSRIRLPASFGVDHRSAVSFSAGMAAAYVFVHVMPEMHGARRAFAESASVELRFEGMAIYFVALLGFLAFYGLDHLRAQLKEGDKEGDARAFRLHIAGFAAYVALVGYLLVRNLEETRVSTLLYATALTFHLATVNHALHEEHGEAFDGFGRHVLAVAAVAGWSLGQALALPRDVVALLLAFVSGAIIMNSAIAELPADKNGRFLPFLVGGLAYGMVLLPLG